MFLEGTLREYVEKAAAATPTPGGGSVAAITGALGASMACMAANFTVGRKKFRGVEGEVRKHLDSCLKAKDALMALAEADAAAYEFVSAAYAMPHDNPAQTAARDEAIQAGLLAAMTPPLEIVRVCLFANRCADALAEIANPNLISDIGVAVLLLDGAVRSAKLNVEVNLRDMKDAARAESTRKEIVSAALESAKLTARTMKKVAAAVGGIA